ncbi:MAG: response regulator [Xanthobacteraceae bacterium]
MLSARRATLRILRTLMVWSVVIPIALFAYASWVNWDAVNKDANEHIKRSLDVMHEHAVRMFQTGELVLDEVTESTNGLSDEQIRTLEPSLHARLQRINSRLPQLQSVWIIGQDANALVSSRTSPPPRGTALSDRDFWQAQVDHDRGTYIGSVLTPRLLEGSNFFSMSRRRTDPEGRFSGVVIVSMLPGDFENFYAEIGNEPGRSFTMIRADGAVLARYPAASEPIADIDPNKSSFADAMAAAATSDKSAAKNRPRNTNTAPSGQGKAGNSDTAAFRTYVAPSPIDGVERRLAAKKLEGYPIYVVAGLNTADIRNQWLSSMGSHLIFGVPATLLLFALLGLAVQRTKKLYAEADRRIAAETALIQAQRLEALGRLTGGVAHDFNNLLMVISGSVSRLSSRLKDDKALRLCDMIATAAKRAETLTRHLLSFSRQQSVNPQALDVAQRISELHDLIRSSLADDVEVTIDGPDEPCPVKVDQAEFEIAVLNICVNARDAMPNGGTLRIATRSVTLDGDPAHDGLMGDFIALSFADTGGGIPAEILPRVFEPFFTTKDAAKGTGLGLSQVYGFTKQAGGTTTIASTPGHGTVVTLYLPQIPYTTDQLGASRESVPLPSAPVRKNVLVVEDNGAVADVCKSFLDDLGYGVQFVSSPHAALAFLKGSEHIDIVLSDVLMPGGMSGLDLARELRRTRPSLPVVLMTGFNSSANELASEGFHVLRKPFDMATLGDEMRAILERRQLADTAA